MQPPASRNRGKPATPGVAANAAWNLAGLGLPVLVALLTIPPLIRALGTERFGVLAIAWAFVGYFSLFDLGLGRAMTRMVASRLGEGDRAAAARVFRTGTVLLAALGLAAAAGVALIAPWLVGSVLEVPAGFRQETLRAFQLIALGMPLVVSSAGLQGTVEAHQRFRTVAAAKLLQGIGTFAGPLLAVQFTPDLAACVAVLLVSRLASWLLLLADCRRSLAGAGPARFDAGLLRPLASFGGWMTLDNLLGPLLLFADRFLVGALLTMSAVAFYATPSELVSRLLVIPAAVVGVLFPMFAAVGTSDPARSARLFGGSVRAVYAAMLPLCVAGIGASWWLLALWLGRDFADESFRVLQWLLAGVLFLGVAHLPHALIAGLGRPDITTKIHLLEIPLYLLALWAGIHAFGVEGAAMAWALRVAADAVLLGWAAARLAPALRGIVRMAIRAGIATALLLLALLLAPVPEGVRAALGAAGALACALLGWSFVLDHEARDEARGLLRRALRR